MTNACALLVDDERDILELLSMALSRMGLRVECADSVAKAKELLGEHTFDLCLTDMRLGDGNGLEIIQHIHSHYPQLPVAMITAYGDVQSAVNALKAGAYDFVSKPVDLNELRNIVQQGLLISATAIKPIIPAQISQETAAEYKQALPDAIERLERLQIQAALEACRYNKTKAAAHLGITFRALRYKLEKLGME